MAINLLFQSIDIMKYFIWLSKLTLFTVVLLPFSSRSMSSDTIMSSFVLDKSIRMGHLSNGFTYYLKPTDDTDEISLRLYVKVGDYNERLSEFQFAHLIEHIAGNQVYHHANLDSGKDEEKFAPNANAETRHISTCYYGTFPGNDVKTLLNRLQGYANISQLSMEEDVIVNEARCVRQELFIRSKGISLNKRFNEAACKSAIFFGKNGKSPYTKWLTSYDMGGVSIPSVREFYHRWYCPSRMGLIITGNIQDIDSLVQNIIAIYSKIPKKTIENDRFNFRPFYLSSSPRFTVAERIEVNRFSNWNKNNSEISMFFRVKKFSKELNTEEKWINEQLYKAMYSMIYQRLKKKGAPLWSSQNGGIIDLQFPNRNYPYFRTPAIKNKSGTERENLQRVTSLLQEILENGFTQKEWSNQKKWIMNKGYSQDTTSSEYWAKQLENHFVYGEILPANKKSITQQWIDNISLKDINSYIKDNFSVIPDDIYITASAGHPALFLTEKQVRGWIKEALNHPVHLKETIDITSLTTINEKGSLLMGTKEVEMLKRQGYSKIGIDKDTGLEILQLGNGVKLLLDNKETNENSSEMITLSGTSTKGASCFPKSQYYAAISAPEIVKLSGAGGFSRKTIRNRFGKKFRSSEEPVQLHIQNDGSTIITKSKLENLEKYLQLVYLYFTSPRKDSLAFQEWQTKIPKRYFSESSLVGPRIDLKNAIADCLNVSAFKSSTNLMNTKQFYGKQSVSFKTAMKCYQTIFGNASHFTFIVKGKYEKEQILPILQKYLGNLPTDDKLSCPSINTTDKNKFKLPIGPVYHNFYADEMNTGYKLYTTWYNLSYVFSIPETNWKDRVVLDFINLYLCSKVKYLLRHVKGIGTYGAITEGVYSETDSLYNLAIYVDGLEDELERIKYECKIILDDLKNHGIGMEAKNRILCNPLYTGRYMSTPKLQKKANQYIMSLNVHDFKTVAAKYLKEENQYEFIFKENNESALKD